MACKDGLSREDVFRLLLVGQVGMAEPGRFRDDTSGNGALEAVVAL